mgnify:FL=1
MIKQWLKIIFSYPYCGARNLVETLIKSALEKTSDKTLLYIDFNMMHIGAKEYDEKKSSEIVLNVVLAILILALVAIIGYLVWTFKNI